MKKWIVANAPVNSGGDVIREFGDFFGGILVRRGINTIEAAQGFFGCQSLSDPLLMKDTERAVEIIRAALDDGRKITVYGDYDCDGVTATAILYSYLEAQGAEVEYYIPDRSEGYGMNVPALERIASGGTELVITVDNGISAIEEARFLKEKGVELIITDHHQPGIELPECAACIDPNRADDSSPFKDLCGAGVVLKLLIALEEDEEFVLDTYAHLAAVGTIGDVMPLKGENRYIVQRGLENIKNEQNAGLTALIRSASRSTENIGSTDVAFCVCPRINAAGRLESAEKALRLLLCEDDAETAKRIAEELSALNNQRKAVEDKIMVEINEQIARDPLITKQRVIVLSGEGWHHGIIGIVCSRILEKYDKPVVLISIEGSEARGSMRSIDGFSAHKMLTECSACLTKFGGHPGAGGFSLPADKIGEFTKRIHEYSREYYLKMPNAYVFADMEPALSELTLDNVKKLTLLEPCGERNTVPLFLLRGCVIRSKRALSNGKYTSFEVTQGNTTLRVITFKIPFAKFFPKAGDRIDLIAAAEINEYNGNESVQLRLADHRPSDFREDRFLAASRVYEEICRGEGCDKRLAPRVIPQSREELMKIYDLVKRSNGEMSAEELAIFDGSVNYCMLRITLDAFAEAGMIEYANDAPRIVPVKEKRDLFANGIIAELKKQFA
ncbi:MAG: single-stranded-DNA-specific exonuclease RecJ [Oscillospiraceae bacterium]|nr:single-stranded-DNA-specific exonuclease RecJ [Oscillospiraceae bacterium]